MLNQVLFASSLVVAVFAHGQIDHVTSNGATVKGPNIYFAGDSANSKTATRVMYKASSPAFVLPPAFNDNSQMSCEGSSNSPAPDTITVPAGGSLDLFWQGATGELLGQGGLTAYNPWVHAMGTVIDYITSCNGACNKFNSLNAGWTKLAHGGIDFSQSISGSLRTAMTNKPEKYYPTSGNGLWAMAKLVQDGSKWTVNIPKSLAPGEYLIRHELAAIHNPLNGDASSGAQVYISCTQIKVTGSGSTNLPSGTQAKDLYSPTGTFAKFNVYHDDIHSFQIPGPAVWDQVSSGGGSSSSNSGSSDSSSGSSSPAPAPANNNPAPAPPKSTPKAPAPAPAPSPAPANTSSNSSSSSPKKCKPRKVKRSADALPLADSLNYRRHRARRAAAAAAYSF